VRSAEQRTIALLGLRGSGKSTIGRLLAAALERPFVDLDEALLSRAHVQGLAADASSAGAVLEQLGEARFRDLERTALEQQLLAARACVLATGGGVVELESNRRLLREACASIWLRVPVPILAERVDADPTRRPALVPGGSLAEARALAARREGWYREAASLELDCDAQTPAAVLVRLLELLQKLP